MGNFLHIDIVLRICYICLYVSIIRLKFVVRMCRMFNVCISVEFSLNSFNDSELTNIAIEKDLIIIIIPVISLCNVRLSLVD